MQTVLNNTNSKDVQLHIDKAYKIIDEYLPENYVEAIINILPKELNVTKPMIYNVKRKASKRLDILNAMVEVALENKSALEKLKNNLNKIA
ncbi:hypothetical protein [Flavobacterium denitrificans]|uniref:hypothetical protein n=1 Tax=Flavobacterium denitrificans TaxID=281361 RepID=UPI000478EBC0|nr:hypothetical protein [Flavobacterium denitrificans]